MWIQATALASLLAVSIIDIQQREIPIWIFLAGLAITSLAGILQAGTTYLIYLALFGTVFTVIAWIGVHTGAWYYGEVLAMPILAAGSYGLHLHWFFLALVTFVPGLATALRYTDHWDDQDEPLLPSFFLVLVFTLIMTSL